MKLLKLLRTYTLQFFGILIFCVGIGYMGFTALEPGNRGQIISIVIMSLGGLLTAIGTYYLMKDKQVKEVKPPKDEMTQQP